VTVFSRDVVVARHPRAAGRGVKVLDLDHYLEILLRKPGALPGATALAQARAAGVFTGEHEAFWAAARKAHGDAAGTRALVEVLLLHRHLRAADVLAGITAALSVWGGQCGRGRGGGPQSRRAARQRNSGAPRGITGAGGQPHRAAAGVPARR